MQQSPLQNQKTSYLNQLSKIKHLSLLVRQTQKIPSIHHHHFCIHFMVLSLVTRMNSPTLYLTHELTDNNVRALTLRTESWRFILFIVICHDLLFQIKKNSKVMRTSAVSLKVIETEIKATEQV